MMGEISDEQQYVSLVRRILDRGVRRTDRTGTGTLSLFGEMLTFDLRHGRLPLLTCKRVNYRAVLAELLWFLRGETSTRALERQGVNIWREHGTREALDRRGLTHLAPGDLGPVYGFQWRHAGLTYRDCDTDYFEAARRLGSRRPGYDQIARVIDQLRNDPFSRRIVLNAWNPLAVDNMALPPCHMTLQLYVEANHSLSGMVYMRSSDVGLGLPFNIASYATLLHILARVAGLSGGANSLRMVLGDAHVYLDHVQPLTELMRRPRLHPSPNLEITRPLAGPADDPETNDPRHLRLEDFRLIGYTSEPHLPLHLSV